jgi:hypothetical protein
MFPCLIHNIFDCELAAAEAKKVVVSASVECELCEFVITNVDSVIGTNRSEAAITQALDDVCKVMIQ